MGQKAALPQDLITFEILTRLPVKSLLRFKSVSKRWNFLISDDPNFANLHLQFQHQNNNHQQYHLLYDTGNPRLLTLKDNPSQLGEIKNFWDDHNCNASDRLKSRYPCLVGSSNGLLCFYEQPNTNYTLWNPATRALRLIRGPSDRLILSFNYTIICQGFGYSPSCDDYKIVILCRFTKTLKVVAWCVYVFGTRTNQWRRIDIDPSVRDFDSITTRGSSVKPSVQVGETLHWVLNPWFSNNDVLPIVLAFDLANDSIHLVPLPDNGQTHGGRAQELECTISKIGGRLCVAWRRIRTKGGDPRELMLEVWMLDKYEEPESWKILFTHRGLNFFYFTLHNLLEVKDNSGRIFVLLSEYCDHYQFLIIDSPPPLARLSEPPQSYLKINRVVISKMYRASSNTCWAVDYIESLVSPFYRGRASKRLSGIKRRISTYTS